jgi:hypothetical protein
MILIRKATGGVAAPLPSATLWHARRLGHTRRNGSVCHHGQDHDRQMLEFLTAFWTCSIRFLRSWSGLSSAVAAALGALKSMGFEVPLPAWVWWSGAIAILFVSAIFLEMSLQNERDKNKKTEPNFKLEELVRARQHARQRRAVSRRIVLELPPPGHHERQSVARSRTGADLRPAHGVHPLLHRRR